MPEIDLYRKDEIIRFRYEGREFEVRYTWSSVDPLDKRIQGLETVMLNDGFCVDDNLKLFRSHPPHYDSVKALNTETLEVLKNLPAHFKAVIKLDNNSPE